LLRVYVRKCSLYVNFCLVMTSKWEMCEFVCRSIRVQVRTTATFTREVEGDVQRIVGYFQTTPELINSSTNRRRYSFFLGLPGRKFQRQRKWVHIDRTLEFTIVITKYRPLHGRSYILNGCKASTASSTSAKRTKSVSYGLYFPVSTSFRVTRNTPIIINLLNVTEGQRHRLSNVPETNSRFRRTVSRNFNKSVRRRSGKHRTRLYHRVPLVPQRTPAPRKPPPSRRTRNGKKSLHMDPRHVSPRSPQNRS